METVNINDKKYFYQMEIEQQKNIFMLRPFNNITDCFEIVRDCQKEGRLLKLELRWSWRHFNWLYYFEFTP
jgi:hypothetical protein